MSSRPPVGCRHLRRIVLVALAAVCLSGMAPAWAGAIDALDRFLAKTQRASGTFVQSTAANASARAERSSGRFAFERPGRFRWEVQRPFEQLMIADGSKVWFYDKDLNQVTVRPAAEAMGATPAAILFGSAGLDRNFVLSEGADRDGLEWLEAVPRSRDAGFEKIRIGFRDSLPRAMEVVDAFGRAISFAFDDIIENPPIDPPAFRFTPPPGADVVAQ